MGRIAIGKVRMTHAGQWVANRGYEANTCVTHDGSSYVSLVDMTVENGLANRPPVDDGVYWRLVASKGAKGDKGADGTVSFNSLTAEQRQSLKGDTGSYLKPTVSESGDLSWTFSDDTSVLPDTVNIKGPKGDPGDPAERIVSVYIDENTGHLMMTTYTDSLSDMLFLGDDGHLYARL